MDIVFIANLVVAGIVEGLLIALAALAMTLVFGVARFPNAATGDFMAFGAYAALMAYATAGMPIWLAAAIAILATAILALVSYRFVFSKLLNRSPVANLLASIGVALILRSALSWYFGSEQRTFAFPLVRSMNFGGVRIHPTDLAVVGVALAALATVFVLLYATPLGRRMRAVADNPLLARASGIRSAHVMVALWLIAGGVSALAGVLLGVKAIVTPEMGFDVLLHIFTATVLGGIGNPLGAVVGGLVIGIAQELASPIVGASYKLAVGFVVLVALLLVRPQGLFGGVEVTR
jgi:branched-chain amino acid transport system permease protein